MPDTTTATWPSLLAGHKARASEVEAKFDWAEANLWPHSAGVTADATYDLGKSGARWKNGWFSGGFNPTSTAAGIAIGKDAANANTSLDLSAMPKAFYLPILTTTQRNALTPQSGFLIYNSTNSRMERYEGGQWAAMNSAIGVATTIYQTATISPATTSVLSVVGSGRIKQINIGRGSGVVGNIEAYLKFDSGTALYGFGIWSSTIQFLTVAAATTTALAFTTATQNIDLYFKSSLDIYFRTNSTQSASYVIIYEKN